MNYQSILLSREGSVAVITLNEPASANTFNPNLVSEVRHALAAVRADSSVRALLLTANGRLFCAGADLKGGGRDRSGYGEHGAKNMREHLNPMIAELHEQPVPVVIAVNGGAAGAGVGLALAGDVILAARSAYFYLPFIPRLGIVPDLGASWFLQRRIGSARALALSVSGERLSAEKAERWGMIHACVDDAALHDEALRMARQLARLPAHGMLEARALFDAAERNDLRAQLDYEADRQRELLDLPSFREGVQAFLEKRDPEFAGRE